MNYKFIRPKTPTYNKGILVIHSDDGFLGDYTHWLPLLKKKSSEYSQWHNSGTAVMCPAINTATIGNTGMMTKNHLQEMLQNRCEVLSHGRHHVGIGALPVIVAVSGGSTRIDINGANQLSNGKSYTYRIFEGSKEEEFQISSTSGDSYGAGHLITVNPLKNSYSTTAKVQLTDSSANELLQGCINDAKAWGIDLTHHVYTYHSGGQHFYSNKSENWIGQYFIAGGRGNTGGTNFKDTMNIKNLKSQLNTEINNSGIDGYLDNIAQNDGLFIFYGHGEKDATNLAKLEYLIDGALSRGIRIETISTALKRMGKMI